MLPVSLVASCLLPAASAAAASFSSSSEKSPAFFLAGDSTTASNGGWGDAFLASLTHESWGLNFAASGASTVSFKADGFWTDLTSHVRDNADYFDILVTIQFGHNDQKEALHISPEEFEANLESMASEIRSLGAWPIVISPLTRRVFDTHGSVVPSLETERQLSELAASNTQSIFLDLNQASANYVHSIGEKASHEYNLAANDTTHLNEHGAVVFGRMVADLLLEQAPGLREYIIPNEQMSERIWNGLPA